MLRVETGQQFEITDNARVWLAEVEDRAQGAGRVPVLEEIAAGPQTSPVTLYLALIKFERFEWAVEKATNSA